MHTNRCRGIQKVHQNPAFFILVQYFTVKKVQKPKLMSFEFFWAFFFSIFQTKECLKGHSHRSVNYWKSRFLKKWSFIKKFEVTLLHKETVDREYFSHLELINWIERELNGDDCFILSSNVLLKLFRVHVVDDCRHRNSKIQFLIWLFALENCFVQFLIPERVFFARQATERRRRQKRRRKTSVKTWSLDSFVFFYVN